MLTEEQNAAWKEFCEAAEKCSELGIDFIDQFDGNICAMNGNNVISHDYEDEAEDGETLVDISELPKIDISPYRFEFDDVFFGVKFKE